MSSKTKIVVLHMKEIIYTTLFIMLSIVLILLLVFMFGIKDKKNASEASYRPGVYTSAVTLGSTDLEVEVTVDSSRINSVRFSNLDDSVAAMLPLARPAMEEIAKQIYEKQSLDDVQYSEESPYTSQVILNAVACALKKASVK